MRPEIDILLPSVREAEAARRGVEEGFADFEDGAMWNVRVGWDGLRDVYVVDFKRQTADDERPVIQPAPPPLAMEQAANAGGLTVALSQHVRAYLKFACLPWRGQTKESR